jgi:hypothetical protein
MMDSAVKVTFAPPTVDENPALLRRLVSHLRPNRSF